MTINIDAPSSSGWYTDVSCRVTKSSQFMSSIWNWNTVSWDSESYDTDGYHDNVTNNNRLTIPSWKWWKHLVIVNITTDQWYAQDQWRLIINWSTIIAQHHNQLSHKWFTLSAEYSFSVWDYVEYQHYPAQNNCNIANTSSFSIRKLS